jgi:Transposase DDE domain
VLHTFWAGKLRLVLDMQVNSGKQHTSMRAKTALERLLDELGDGPDSRRPTLLRGDSGYGNEGILLELENRNQPYLLRQTANVQRLVAQQFARQDCRRADNQGSARWLRIGCNCRAAVERAGWSSYANACALASPVRARGWQAAAPSLSPDISPHSPK